MQSGTEARMSSIGVEKNRIQSGKIDDVPDTIYPRRELVLIISQHKFGSTG